MATPLDINPKNELVFDGPFTEVVNSSLILTNYDSENSVCFKVKTTAPKRYCVRPNNGVISPNDKAEILVMRQAYEPEEQERKATKHKFMLQSTSVKDPPQGEALEKLWKDETNVTAYKLKCVFVDSSCENETEQEVPASLVQQNTETTQSANSPSIEEINKSQYEEIVHLKDQIASLETNVVRLRTLEMKNTTRDPAPVYPATKMSQPAPASQEVSLSSLLQQPTVLYAMFLCLLFGMFLSKMIF